MGRKCIDLTGQKFGKLTVIKRVENKGIQPCWLCKCECGNEKVIRGSNLKSGTTMSCGCLQSEKMKEQMKELWQDEDFKKMQSKKMKEQLKELWQDEDYKKMQSGKMKQLNEEQWKDEDFRKVQSEKSSKKMKEQWQDEDFRKMKSKKMKEQWKDEDFRKVQSEKAKERWQDEEMKWKMHYKGGITPISQHLRHLNSQWFEDCKQKANYTCQLTGKHGGNLHTHHLKAFSTIVIEAHDLHNIQIKDQVKDYTQEELKLLEEYVGSWHKDNSNAVVLSKDVHKLFHSLYGCGENTPEQFEEFRERYIAGEFKEILK